MSQSKSKAGLAERWAGRVSWFKLQFPHLWSWQENTDAFRGLNFVARDDGTVLGIAKGYGPDGGMVVAFGSGYDVVTAFEALDRTIQGGHWKVDKPWEEKKR